MRVVPAAVLLRDLPAGALRPPRRLGRGVRQSHGARGVPGGEERLPGVGANSVLVSVFLFP